MEMPPDVPDTAKRIEEAIEAIASGGADPTYDGVRQRLGGGSYSTIKPILQGWRAARAAKAAAAAKVTLPPEVLASAQDHALLVWQRASATAAAGFETERQAQIGKLADAEKRESEALAAADRAVEEAAQAKAELAKLQEDLAKARERILIAKREDEILREQLAGANVVTEKLRQELSTAEGRISEVGSQLRDAQARNDEQRAIIAGHLEKIGKLEERFESQAATLSDEKSRVAALRSQVAAAQEQIQTAKGEATSLGALLRTETQRSSAAEARLGEMARSQEELRSEIDRLHQQHKELLTTLTQKPVEQPEKKPDKKS